jgi:hypothetical protein
MSPLRNISTTIICTEIYFLVACMRVCGRLCLRGLSWLSLRFLGAFAKFLKAVSFVMSARPHGTTRLPLDEFSLKLYMRIFRNSVEKTKDWLKYDNNGTSHADLRTFVIIFRWSLLRMRHISDKSCTENQNTHFMFNNFFPENRAVYEIMWKIR